MGVPTVSATIAIDESLSSAIDLGGGILAGVIIPPSWTAANVTLLGSTDGVDYYDLYDIYGSEITIVGTAGKLVPTGDIVSFLPVAYVKFRSGTGASAVTQEAAREIKAIVRAV